MAVTSPCDGGALPMTNTPVGDPLRSYQPGNKLVTAVNG